MYRLFGRVANSLGKHVGTLLSAVIAWKRAKLNETMFIRKFRSRHNTFLMKINREIFKGVFRKF